MCDIVWWSLFSDSFNSGFICSRTVNLALNRTLNCHWTNDRPFFTTSIRCEHQPLSFIWNILRSIYFKIHLGVFFFSLSSSVYVQVYCAVFICFNFRFGYVFFFLWPPVDRTIENWITCRHNLSLHRFITLCVWCCATIIRFIACSVTLSVTFIDDGILEELIQSDSYITPWDLIAPSNSHEKWATNVWCE